MVYLHLAAMVFYAVLVVVFLILSFYSFSSTRSECRAEVPLF